MSVRDYAATIEDFRELSPAEANELPKDYMKYVYYPLRAGLDAPQIFSGSSIDAASGIPGMNYRAELTIADPDQLTSGSLRNALAGVLAELERFDYRSATKDEVQAYAAELASIFSDGETLALDVMAELPGPDSPYNDPVTLEALKRYAALGLEYDQCLGEIHMRYRGTEVNAIVDPTVGTISANTAGPTGLGGDSILIVTNENSKPAGLRFAEPDELSAMTNG